MTASAATPTAPQADQVARGCDEQKQPRTRSGGDWDPIPADVVTALWIGRVSTSRKRTDADTHQRWDDARPTTVALIVDVKRSMFLVLTVADAQGPRSSMRKSGVSLFPPITHGFGDTLLGFFASSARCAACSASRRSVAGAAQLGMAHRLLRGARPAIGLTPQRAARGAEVIDRTLLHVELVAVAVAGLADRAVGRAEQLLRHRWSLGRRAVELQM